MAQVCRWQSLVHLTTQRPDGQHVTEGGCAVSTGSGHSDACETHQRGWVHTAMLKDKHPREHGVTREGTHLNSNANAEANGTFECQI